MVKKIGFGLFIAVFVLSMMAMTGGEVVAQDELIVAQGATRTTMDPQGQNDQPSAQVRAMIYDTLLFQTEDMEIEPGLAHDWEQIDDVTWEFYLREGVYFHNGEELTAQDVKFTYERLIDPEEASPSGFILEILREIEVVDDYTIRLHLEEPFVPLLSHLTHTSTSILNQTAVEEAGEDYGTIVVVGSGPYEYVDWATGDYILLERNDDYWGELPQTERLRFRAIPEDTVRAIEVETGGAHISLDISPVDVARLDEDPEVNLVQYPTLATHYIGFNAQREPFDNVKVRQAINYAVDIDPIVEYVYEGQAVAAQSPISDMVWGAHPDLEPYGYDVERARELLAEAGYEDGFSTTIYTNDNPQRIQISELVQENLRQLNIDVEVSVLDWGDYLERTGEGEHDMFVLGWVAVTGDADYGMYSLFHSNQFGHAGNRTFWSHPEVDDHLEAGRRIADTEIRLSAYHSAQEIIRDEAPWIFMIHTEAVHGLRDNVTGFVPHPAGHHNFGAAYFTE